MQSEIDLSEGTFPEDATDPVKLHGGLGNSTGFTHLRVNVVDQLSQGLGAWRNGRILLQRILRLDALVLYH